MPTTKQAVPAQYIACFNEVVSQPCPTVDAAFEYLRDEMGECTNADLGFIDFYRVYPIEVHSELVMTIVEKK